MHIKISSRRDGIMSWTEALSRYLMKRPSDDEEPWYNPDGRSNLMMYGDDGGIGRALSLTGGPLLKIDGPHAAPCTHIPHYETVMLVAGGIGLTPFASALKSLIQFKLAEAVDPGKKSAIRPRHIYFYWLFQMADYEAFQWFAKLLSNLRRVYLAQKQSYLRHSTAPGKASANSQEISLQINLIVTRGDKKNDSKDRDPEGELGMVNPTPTVFGCLTTLEHRSHVAWVCWRQMRCAMCRCRRRITASASAMASTPPPSPRRPSPSTASLTLSGARPQRLPTPPSDSRPREQWRR